MSDVTFSVFKMIFSLHESICFSKYVSRKTYFPILVIVVSSKWYSRLSGSTISMFECGQMSHRAGCRVNLVWILKNQSLISICRIQYDIG